MSLSSAWNEYSIELEEDPAGRAEAQESTESSLFSGWGGGTQDQGMFSVLSHKQRMVGFLLMLLLAAICFGLEVSMIFTGLAVLRPRKFALLHSLGSVCGILCFSMLRGPWAHLQHLLARERAPFSLLYLSALFATLYFAFQGLTIMTMLCSVLQITCLLWYVLSYVPGGTKGLFLMVRMSLWSIVALGRSLLPS